MHLEIKKTSQGIYTVVILSNHVHKTLKYVLILNAT